MRPIEIDDSRFPLIVVRFHGLATDPEFRAYLDAMTAVRRAGGKNVVILDARDAGAAPARQRRMQADWLAEHRELLERDSLGTGFVITSALIRGVLTAILWMAPVPGGHRVFSSYDEAESWALEQLRAAGLTAPGTRQ